MNKANKSVKKVVKEPAAKSIVVKTGNSTAPAVKKVRKEPKSLKLVKKISTAEGLERIRMKKGKK